MLCSTLVCSAPLDLFLSLYIYIHTVCSVVLCSALLCSSLAYCSFKCARVKQEPEVKKSGDVTIAVERERPAAEEDEESKAMCWVCVCIHVCMSLSVYLSTCCC